MSDKTKASAVQFGFSAALWCANIWLAVRRFALVWIAAGLTLASFYSFYPGSVRAQTATSILDNSSPNPAGSPTFVVSEFSPNTELKVIAYGDMRFTKTSDVTSTNPRIRQWLAAKVGQEDPDILLLSGDMPMKGARVADWGIYRKETASWRQHTGPDTQHQIHVYPTIGNHEIFGGEEAGIRNYLDSYPELEGHRYYSVLAGSVEVIALDSSQKQDAGSTQQEWLDAQLAHIPPQVDFVFFVRHFPLMADMQSQFIANLPGEEDSRLRVYLESKASSAHARFIVVSGHIHNYERFLYKGITYVVTGGGGAEPYPILIRGEQDLYRDTGFPVFHYLVFQLKNRRLDVTMYKVVDPEANQLSVEIKDRFSIQAK